MNKNQKAQMTILTKPLNWKDHVADFPSDVVKALEMADKVLLTGSCFICNPPVKDTDIDIMVLTKDFVSYQAFLPFKRQNTVDNPEYDDLVSYRTYLESKNYNILVTTNEKVFETWERCTRVARFLNLRYKEDRSVLFGIMLGEI